MTQGFTKPFLLQHALRVPGPLDHRLQAAAPLLQIHRHLSPWYLRASAATQQMICLVSRALSASRLKGILMELVLESVRFDPSCPFS